MSKLLKVAGVVTMSSTELYQWLLAILYTQSHPTTNTFSYELSAGTSSLFTDDGKMRTTVTSQMAKFIISMNHNVVCDVTKPAVKVVDGCPFIHTLQYSTVVQGKYSWPDKFWVCRIGGAMEDVTRASGLDCVIQFKYIKYIRPKMKHRKDNASPKVI